MFVQGLQQRLGFHDVRVLFAAVSEWCDVCGAAFLVDVNDEVEIIFRGDAIAESDHFAKLPGGIHVQEGNGIRPG